MTVADAPASAGFASFASQLARHGDRVALVTEDGEISYRELAERVDAMARRLGTGRRLVLLAGTNTVDAVVTYLAALASGNPLLLGPDDALAGAYDPDVVVAGGRLEERRAVSAHELHSELALLLTTSGSTGSAKLVRLSYQNLQANAEAIATYLRIGPDDRAATALPIHYCYGLSVVNSHLLRGASLILTGRSVTDPGFWRLAEEHRLTSLAGVPYTFELLDRVGFETMLARDQLPSLRYLTQAGGRLPPAEVRRYASLGRRHGFELFVMYGQTEATARMAYLPPELAESHPHCIGVPIPGGEFRLRALPDWPEPEVGELFYTGPNVMLGYAESPADLGLGRTVTELHTGDVARRTADGLYEIVGRQARFVKLFGLRIDLHRLERALTERGITAYCVGDDRRLVVAVEAGDAGQVRRIAAEASGLPPRAIRVRVLPVLPRLPNGKPDYPAVLAHAHTEPAPVETDLRRLYAEVLGVATVTDADSFASLGGDSLSYVEMSIRLERALDRLPENWHALPIRELRPAKPRRLRRLDIGVALRALAIVLITGTHAGLFNISGGGHLLLGVAGYNFARFHLGQGERADRVRRIGRSLFRVAVASMTWIALVYLLTDDYSLANVFLVNYLFGTGGEHHWQFWFIETLIYIQLAVLAVLAMPVVDRLERRHPFWLPFGLAGLGLVTRYGLVPGVDLTPPRVFWLFALGWAAARATTVWQRGLVTVAVVATVPGFFGYLPREAVIIAGMTLLVWVRGIPSLRSVNRVAAVLAGASLFIYLTHWQVYPHLYQVSPLLAVLASVAVGIGYAAVVRGLRRHHREHVLCGRQGVRVRGGRDRLGLDPPGFGRRAVHRWLGGDDRPALGTGGWDHPGGAQRGGQFPVHPVLPVLVTPDHRAERVRDLGFERVRTA